MSGLVRWSDLGKRFPGLVRGPLRVVRVVSLGRVSASQILAMVDWVLPGKRTWHRNGRLNGRLIGRFLVALDITVTHELGRSAVGIPARLVATVRVGIPPFLICHTVTLPPVACGPRPGESSPRRHPVGLFTSGFHPVIWLSTSFMSK